MYIAIEKIIIPNTQRSLRPWKVTYLTNKIQESGYDPSYPITLRDDNATLIDGGHRLAAAKQAGIETLPYIALPTGADPVAHAIRANQDGADTEIHDVFDLAELCWRLSEAGQTGKEIGDRLGWSSVVVTYHKQIKEQLHHTAWTLARELTKKPILVNDDSGDIVNPKLTIVNWRESHFRAFLKHLPHDGTRAAMRAQVEAIRELTTLPADKKLTAKRAGAVARRYAWQSQLKCLMRDTLVPEVVFSDWKILIQNVQSNVYGKLESEANGEKFYRSLMALNEEALGVKLYCEDALQQIPLLEDSSIALVVTDPPYNVTEHEWDKIGSDEEYLDWTREWLDAIRPKLAENYHLFVFCDLRYQARMENLLLTEGWPLKSRIVWEYRNLVKGRDVTDKFICNWQMIFHCGTHSLNWSPNWDDTRFAVQNHASPQSNFKEGKQHPTQKPLSLIQLLVEVGSAPGDKVLDPFAGSGTTGSACSAAGQRQCILIEREDGFCTIIENRLKVSRESS